MKTVAYFSALLLSFISFNALAYPDVGDKVKWEGTIQLIDGTKTSIQIVKEVLKYNADAKKWTVKFETTMGKETSTELAEVEELFSPEKYKDLITHCTHNGGEVQNFKAPAGTYETCKITTINQNGVIVEKWWGNIPFGIVSKATKDSRNSKTARPDLKSVIADL